MIQRHEQNDDTVAVIDRNYFTVDEFGRYLITDPSVLEAISGGEPGGGTDHGGGGAISPGTNNSCQTQNTGCQNNGCRDVGDDGGDDDGGDDDGGDDDGGDGEG